METVCFHAFNIFHEKGQFTAATGILKYFKLTESFRPAKTASSHGSAG